MNDYIKGYDLNLYFYVNGQPFPVAHATDCQLKLYADIQETTTKSGSRGKTYEYTGKYGYTLTLSGITNFVDIANFSLFQDCIIQGQKLQFAFTENVTILYSGTVLIPEINITSQFDAISLFQQTLQGDGDIAKVTQNLPPSPPSATVEIIDQFGNTVATVQAPGTYGVLVFDTIEQGHAVDQTEQLIIMPAA